MSIGAAGAIVAVDSTAPTGVGTVRACGTGTTVATPTTLKVASGADVPAEPSSEGAQTDRERRVGFDGAADLPARCDSSLAAG